MSIVLIKNFVEIFLLAIQLHHDDNLGMLQMTLVEIFYTFALMFAICELCQRVNMAFDECSDIVDQLEWYRFPIEIQRMLPFIQQFTQQPVEITCFGSKACDRESFKYVSMCICTQID